MVHVLQVVVVGKGHRLQIYFSAESYDTCLLQDFGLDAACNDFGSNWAGIQLSPYLSGGM